MDHGITDQQSSGLLYVWADRETHPVCLLWSREHLYFSHNSSRLWDKVLRMEVGQSICHLLLPVSTLLKHLSISTDGMTGPSEQTWSTPSYPNKNGIMRSRVLPNHSKYRWMWIRQYWPAGRPSCCNSFPSTSLPVSYFALLIRTNSIAAVMALTSASSNLAAAVSDCNFSIWKEELLHCMLVCVV